MAEEEKTISDTLLNRIFSQIDTNTENILELAKITSKHSSTLGILKKILVSVILFILISSLTIIFTFTDFKINSFLETTVTNEEQLNRSNANVSLEKGQEDGEENNEFLFWEHNGR